MTQAKIIRALQNGPLTSHEVSNLTGMPQATVLSTTKKLKSKGEITIDKVKVGRYWVAKYSLIGYVESARKVNPYDIFNSVGIFTPAEYRVMNAQAARLYKANPDFTKQITNNQKI